MAAHGNSDILVIHPGALGDVLQAVPALRAVGAGARVTFSGQPRLGAILRGLGVVAAALPFDGLGLQALFTWDTPPPPALSRFARVVSWFGARDEIYRKRLSALAPGCVIAAPVPEAPVPVWRHLLETIVPAGTSAAPDLAAVALPEAWRQRARGELDRLGARPERPLVVVHPGAGGEQKLWPAEAFARVIQEAARARGCQVLIHQGPADRESTGRLLDLLEIPPLRLVEPDLPLLAGVLGEASAYLGGDSGVSHLAAAVGAAAVIAFPAPALERWRPWSRTAVPVPLGGEAADVEAVARAVSGRLEAAGPAQGRPCPEPGYLACLAMMWSLILTAIG